LSNKEISSLHQQSNICNLSNLLHKINYGIHNDHATTISQIISNGELISFFYF